MKCRSLLALDIGTKTGWCIVTGANTDHQCYESGVWKLGVPQKIAKKYHKSYINGMRLSNLYSSVDCLLDNNPNIDCVVWESVEFIRFRLAYTTHKQLLGALEMCLVDRSLCNCYGIPVGTIKKYATGKGNAKKCDMLKAAQLEWPGVEYQTDDEVDARWVAATACGRMPTTLE